MPLNARYARAPIGSVPGWGITKQSFDTIEDFMADVQGMKQRSHEGMGLLIRLIALTTQGYAQQQSAGPVAPRRRSVAALAGRIPVQRITGEYFAGWQARQVAPNRVVVFNPSFEAWLIEDGIYQRRRRPILKLSIIAMLRMLQTTRTGERFLEGMLGPRRNGKGQFRSFENRARGAGLMFGAGNHRGRGASNPNITGPSGRLPG